MLSRPQFPRLESELLPRRRKQLEIGAKTVICVACGSEDVRFSSPLCVSATPVSSGGGSARLRALLSPLRLDAPFGGRASRLRLRASVL
jgi:hypothetical protein